MDGQAAWAAAVIDGRRRRRTRSLHAAEGGERDAQPLDAVQGMRFAATQGREAVGRQITLQMALVVTPHGEVMDQIADTGAVGTGNCCDRGGRFAFSGQQIRLKLDDPDEQPLQTSGFNGGGSSGRSAG